MIRHISFDLWMTLLRSHPEAKMERAGFFNPARGFISILLLRQDADETLSDRIEEGERNGNGLQGTIARDIRIILPGGSRDQVGPVLNGVGEAGL